MSIKQMSIVFDDKTLNPTQKLIMLSLADNANDSGVAFPSINTIKSRTNLSTGAVTNNIKWLIENGYLFKVYRSRKKGGRSSNKYLIYPHKNRGILDEDDYLIFENMYSQIPPDRVPPQIPPDRVGGGSQIPPDRVESEPSLKEPNHHLGDHGGKEQVPDIQTPPEKIYDHYTSNIKASTSRQQSLNNISYWLKKYPEEHIIRAIDNYKPVADSQTETKFIKDCKNFFGVARENKGYFIDFIQSTPAYMIKAEPKRRKFR